MSSTKSELETNLNQLNLLLWKNYALQKRSIIGLILELILPAFFAIILLPIRGIVKSQDHPNDTYFTPYSPDLFPPGFIPKPFFKTLSNDYWCMAYSPNDVNVTNTIMNDLENKYGFRIFGFKNEEDAVDYVTNQTNYKTCLGAITFSNVSVQNFTYSIRLSYSPRNNDNNGLFRMDYDWKTNLLYTLFPVLGPREKTENDGGDPGYYREGFLTIQKAVEASIISHYSQNSEVDSIKILLQRFPYPPYNDDNFVLVIQALFPFIIMLSFVFTVILTAKAIVYEKESGIKEAMKLMGMKTWIYWLSWYIKTMVLLLPGVAFMIISFKVRVSVKGGGHASILNQTDPSILVLFFFIYMTSSITFTFMVTTFFKKSNSAAAGAGIIWFLSYLPYIFISIRYQEMNLAEKIFAAFFNNLGMSEAIQLIGMFEGKGVGMRWSNINEGISVDDTFTFLQVIIMLIVACFVHLLLTYYFESINPGDHGIAKPWNFPIYWLFPKLDNSELYIENPADVNTSDTQNLITSSKDDETHTSNEHTYNEVFIENEAQYASRNIGIKISNLSKIFKQFGVFKAAVKDLTLNVYENHITVLLGHNGAGKSTTISMITGIAKPSNGSITVNGFDIVSDTRKARKILGYCPQHNILFEDLTVYEHLMFYSSMKENFNDQEIDSMLEALGISEKKYSLAKTLSGGMKRKLSVAIAFIGGSQIVILDEPTSGMDPQARHSTWSLLQKFKKEKNCTILLTTHFMDEADILGDRIAIMSRGSLRCCGSSLYLKSKYGSGYNLVLTKRNNDETEESFNSNESSENIIKLIKGHIPNSKLHTNINSEISFVLPKEECAKFPQLLIDLETQKDSLGIVNVGISITTVEEVFLRIGDLENCDDLEHQQAQSLTHSTLATANGNGKGSPNQYGTFTNISIDDIDESGLWIGSNEEDRIPPLQSLFLRFLGLSRLPLLCHQFFVLFYKRVIHSFRNTVLVISQIIVPFATLLIILLYLKYAPIKPQDSPPLLLKLSKYRSNYVPFVIDTSSNDSNIFVNKLSKYFVDVFSTIDNAKPFNLNDNKTVSICSDKRENIDTFLACIGRYSLTYINDNYVLGSTFFDNTSSIYSNHTTIISHFNDQPYHVPPLALNSITNTLYKYYTNSNESTINVINHPLPRNLEEQISDLQLKNAAGFNISTTLTFGFAFLISSFVMFLIKERVSGSKHSQYLSGANVYVFWTSAFLWDFINYMIPTIISIILLWVFGISQFIDEGRIKYVFGLFILYGLAHIPQAYLISYLFRVPATGFAVCVAWNLLSSQATLTATGILELPMLGLLYVADLLEWIFLTIFPNYAFGAALTDLYNNVEAIKVCENFVEFCKYNISNPCCYGYKFPNPCGDQDCLEWTENYMDWRRPGLLRFFVFMPIQFIVQFSLVIMYEAGFLRKIIYKIDKLFISDKALLQSDLERMEIERLHNDVPKDEDVVQEERRIQQINPYTQRDELLLISSLTKYYSTFMAVKGVSFGMKTSECFGLLGVNGAGKTTTFKMLTGDENITKGNVYLKNLSIKSNLKAFQQQIGYCPQFDPLIDQMTCLETLMMFASLRGIKRHLIKNCCYSLIKLLDLQDHVEKMCYTLSGGNKRKLSVAISLIGSPNIVFLDEPTSGMDPKTRRFLWNCLNRIRNRGKSLILTTHSMDETEALCTRLGIMVNGELKCLGSLQHLKSRYGEGYSLLVKIAIDSTTYSTENVSQFIQFIVQQFPNNILKETRDGFVNFHINDNSIKMLANIFSCIESVKTKYAIEFYAVTQTKLEQIFLNFASRQIDPDSRFLTNTTCCAHRCCC